MDKPQPTSEDEMPPPGLASFLRTTKPKSAAKRAMPLQQRSIHRVLQGADHTARRLRLIRAQVLSDLFPPKWLTRALAQSNPLPSLQTSHCHRRRGKNHNRCSPMPLLPWQRIGGIRSTVSSRALTMLFGTHGMQHPWHGRISMFRGASMSCLA